MAEPLPAPLHDAVIGAAVDRMKRIIEGVADPGAFIASDAPTAWPIEVAKDLARAGCEQYALATDIPAPQDAALGAFCDPYLNANGMTKGQGQYSPPWQGGMCPVLYTVTVDIFSSATGVTGTAQINGNQGPIQAITTRVESCSGPFAPNGQIFVFNVLDANGVTRSVPGSCTDTTYSFSNLQVTRADGLPDECGNPPATEYEPTQPTGNPPPPGWGDTTVIVSTPAGDYEVEVTLNEDGNIEISSESDTTVIAPDGTIVSGPGVGNPVQSGEPQTGTSGAGATDELFPPPPPGAEWIGCQVELLAYPAGLGRIPQSAPYDVFPSSEGNARLLMSDEDGREFVGHQAVIKQKDSLLVRPDDSLIVDGVAINLKPGYNYRVIPLYKQIED